MKLDEWPDWTDWLELQNLTNSDIPPQPGCYIIAAKHKLNRAFGVDDEGILDIGMSGNLCQRISSFRRSAQWGAGGHMAGWRFALHEMEKVFPFKSLSVSWRTFDSRDEAATEEARLLTEYISQHKELPPLNYNVPWRRMVSHG